MPDLQLLIYANTDLANAAPSMQEKAKGFGLEAADIEWFNSQWMPDRAMYTEPRVSPLRGPDLAGPPAAIVVTCEHDPLRDQGEAYADRLQEAGVRTTLRREPGMVHSFSHRAGFAPPRKFPWNRRPPGASRRQSLLGGVAETLRQGDGS